MLEKVRIIGEITLKELRSLTDMTQEEFANYVDIPYTTYRRYERDMKHMDTGKLFQISEKTGVPIERFKRP